LDYVRDLMRDQLAALLRGRVELASAHVDVGADRDRASALRGRDCVTFFAVVNLNVPKWNVPCGFQRGTEVGG